MSFVFFNANSSKKLVIDCTVRAIAKATNQSWEMSYIGLAVKGYELKNMPNANEVWGAYLRDLGFTRRSIPNTCPDCYSVREFCLDHPNGTFLLATGDHVVTVIDGDYYDTWDSGDAIPVYYWFKGED